MSDSVALKRATQLRIHEFSLHGLLFFDVQSRLKGVAVDSES